MKKKPLITISFRVDPESLKRARGNGFNVSEYVRWVIDAMANQEIKMTPPKVEIKKK